MSIAKSIFSLAKYNNGLFKSVKQAEFLISMLDKKEGLISYANSGYNSIPFFAEYDNKGITKIYKHRRTKKGYIKDVTFERKEDGVLTELEFKSINKIKRKLNVLNKEIKKRQEDFESGNYNSSGDISTYGEYEIELFNKFQKEKIESARKLQSRLDNLNKQK